MDEPTSALDPISTSKVEELATELKENYTIVMVTHNMQQAARISDKTAFFLLGELVEMVPTGASLLRLWISAPRIISRAASVKEDCNMGTSVRKMGDAELLQLDTMLADGPCGGAARSRAL